MTARVSMSQSAISCTNSPVSSSSSYRWRYGSEQVQQTVSTTFLSKASLLVSCLLAKSASEKRKSHPAVLILLDIFLLPTIFSHTQIVTSSAMRIFLSTITVSTSIAMMLTSSGQLALYQILMNSIAKAGSMSWVSTTATTHLMASSANFSLRRALRR